MSSDGNSSPIYVSILQSPDDGTVWLHIQLPTGPLARGPYRDLEEANRVAAALERVARRHWALDGREATQFGGRIGNPPPQAPTTGHAGNRPLERRIVAEIADFLAFWPISSAIRLDFLPHESDVYTHYIRT